MSDFFLPIAFMENHLTVKNIDNQVSHYTRQILIVEIIFLLLKNFDRIDLFDLLLLWLLRADTKPFFAPRYLKLMEFHQFFSVNTSQSDYKQWK